MTPRPPHYGLNVGMDKDTTFLAWALRYAQLGWRVFPCAPREKRPLISDWPNQATTDPARIREWWGKWPEANIGVLCGAGLAVLDFDPRNGGDWGDYPLPSTIVCHTGGGGRHYYFAAPSGVRSTKVAPGVDLKGEGGYVIAPPSIHPSGGAYVWEVGAAPWEAKLAPLPEWAQSGPRQSGAGGETLWRLYKGRAIPEGQRNNVLTSYAGHLRRKGLGEGEILEALRAWNTRCVPPLPDREVVTIAKSIAKRPAPERAELGGKRGKRELALDQLVGADWVRYRGRPYIAYGGELFPLAHADGYLYQHGIYVGAQTGREAAELAMRAAERSGRIRPLAGLVITDGSLRYGTGGGREGIWFRHRGKVYCYTTSGGLEAYSTPPEGVYYVVGAELPIMPEGGDEADLLEYMALALANLHIPIRREVAIAAILPVVLGLGRAGLLLEGEGGSGKSTAGKAIYRLAYGDDPPTPIGDSRRDLVATMAGRRLAYHDDLEVLDRDQEAIIRIGITGGKAEVRELYTTAPEQLALVEGAILCGVSVGFRDTTTIQRMIRLHFRAKRRGFERDIEQTFAELAPKAMAGALRLFARAAREAPPEPTDMPEMRLRDWFGWAIRFARVLRVEAEFREWLVRMDEGLLERIQPWGALWHLLREGAVDAGRPILLNELAKQVLMRQGLDENEAGEAAKRLVASVARGAARQKLATVAERAGFAFELRRERDAGSRKQRWFVVFERRTYEAPERAEARSWAVELMGRLATEKLPVATDPTQDTAQVTALPHPAHHAGHAIQGTEGDGRETPISHDDGDSAVGGWGSWGEIREYIERSVRDMLWPHRAKILAMRNEVMKGIDPRGPMGALVVRLFGLMDSLIGLAGNLQARQIEVQLWPDIPEKGQELGEIKQLWADLQHIVGLIERHTELFGKAATLAMIEAAPGRLWYANRGVLDKLRAAGFGDTADRHGDMIQERDGYQARLGMAFIAWEVWGRREENPEGFARVWPGLRIHLENALGEGWPNLLGIPDEPPSMELPF